MVFNLLDCLQWRSDHEFLFIFFSRVNSGCIINCILGTYFIANRKQYYQYFNLKQNQT